MVNDPLLTGGCAFQIPEPRTPFCVETSRFLFSDKESAYSMFPNLATSSAQTVVFCDFRNCAVAFHQLVRRWVLLKQIAFSHCLHLKKSSGSITRPHRLRILKPAPNIALQMCRFNGQKEAFLVALCWIRQRIPDWHVGSCSQGRKSLKTRIRICSGRWCFRFPTPVLLLSKDGSGCFCPNFNIPRCGSLFWIHFETFFRTCFMLKYSLS